jgi:hypothetical protein
MKYVYDRNHKFTLRDIDNLKAVDRIKYDKRSFYKYMRDILIDTHPILNLIFKRSLKDPVDIRVLFIFTSFNLTFAVNALLFSDGYIDQRANADKLLRQSFIYTLGQEILKTFLSLAFSTTLDSILGVVFHISDSTTRDLNNAMVTKDFEKIKEE